MFAPDSNSCRFLLAALSFAFVLGCNRQQEGERCALTNGDSDCEDDLLCTEAETLRANDGVDRCCPDPEESPSDARCALRTTAGDGDGDAPIAGQGGAGGASGDDEPLASMDEACQYPSDCVPPLVCGPGGKCQFECRVDIDCDDGEICTTTDRTCVAAE